MGNDNEVFENDQILSDGERLFRNKIKIKEKTVNCATADTAFIDKSVGIWKMPVMCDAHLKTQAAHNTVCQRVGTKAKRWCKCHVIQL